MTEENKKKYHCKYCGKKMNKLDYEMNNGYCGKCRDLLDWKQVLGDYKKMKKEKEKKKKILSTTPDQFF